MASVYKVSNSDDNFLKHAILISTDEMLHFFALAKICACVYVDRIAYRVYQCTQDSKDKPKTALIAKIP